MVLDFANEAEDIRKAFEPYYEKTILSESTDPNLLYDLENRLLGFQVYSKTDIDTFAAIFFDPKATPDKLYAALAPCVDRFKGLPVEERPDFRGQLSDYIRLYAFLSQIITFKDPDLEKLHVFAKFLGRYLPVDGPTLPVEVQQAIDMESYKIRRVAQGKISLSRGDGVVDPISGRGPHGSSVEEMEALSRIIKELNERFGTDFTEEDKIFIRQLEERLANDRALLASMRGNPTENARLTFDHVVTDRLQDMMDTISNSTSE
jgi:type I restriction enzyme R subunit